MALAISGLLVVAFTANVLLGAVTGQAPAGDVGEMLLLLAASVAFVVAILAREAAERKDD